jgi:branched-chain amino acid transport system ATP-binding protein
VQALRIEHVSKDFGGVHVLRDVSFSLEVGEKAAIIGPNGAGKTTLFNIVGGQTAASSGDVFLFGRRITVTPTHDRCRLGLSRSFQTSSVFAALTVFENVMLALYGVRSSRLSLFSKATGDPVLVTKALELMATVGLQARSADRAEDLSHGEQRKLEILLSLAAEPRVLMLDEPSAGLTAGESDQVIAILHRLPPNRCLLVVAHDMDLVRGVAERIIVLDNGAVVADGSPDEVSCDPRVSEIYMGV